MITELPPRDAPHRGSRHSEPYGSAYGYAREFLGNRFVYVVLSPRAGGLSIGVNMNPDGQCNFACEYCEVQRGAPARENVLNVSVMAGELQHTLMLAQTGKLKEVSPYRHVPDQLLQLQHVALSGDGEPTLCPNFLEAVRAVAHVRATGHFPFFKIVLITNAAGLDLRDVQEGLKLFTPQDEVWAKLDAGTQEYMNCVNHPDCPLDKIAANILLVARQRPVIIQSLFPLINHQEPSFDEIEQYALRLRDLKTGGAQIPMVQIYSATRPMAHPGSSHLPLKTLAHIARMVREVSGLAAEIF